MAASGLPLVSVIVITYRHEAYISECLDHILSQKTTFPFELIIGEDGSDDRTAAICESYAQRYPDIIRLFVRDRKDVVYLDGRPTGKFNFVECCRAARGTYVAICEGDDYWTDPDKLQKQVDFLEAHPDYVLSCHDARVIDKDGNELEPSRLRPEERRDALREDLYKGAYILTLTMCYRNVIREFPPEYYRIHNGDLMLCIMLADYGHCHFQQEVVPASYRVHSGGAWGLRPAEDKWEKARKSYWSICDYFERRNMKQWAVYYAELYHTLSKKLYDLYTANGQTEAARRIYQEDLKFALKKEGVLQGARWWYRWLRRAKA